MQVGEEYTVATSCRSGRIAQAVLALLFLFCLPAFAQVEFNTKAKFAVLMDYNSGTVLYQKDADERMEPASMAKLMTIAVVFDQLQKGRLSLDDEVFISEKAWREGGAASGGSTMFAELDSKVSVGDLVKSVIIQSGNDASIALAEAIGGTELSFVRMMNEMAKDIGLQRSDFANSTGLPDPTMHVTARDLGNLARHIIKTYPEYYSIFSEPSFEWNNINQGNRNTLLDDGIGVDGLKTGHTESAGYGIVASTTENGRRLIAVLHGMESKKQRTEEARKLLTWGSRSFERIQAFDQDQIVAEIPVYGGEKPKVGLTGEGQIDLYVPKGSKRCLSAKIVYNGPLIPPVDRGQQVASLQVWCDDKLIQSSPLYAAETIEQGGIVRRATDALKELAFGWI
ncbi:D-alanyl-D-alanine carboxypeptidase family protein [uncultured Maritalea sp.]|uniref:D-alanyl-D-alanine carboxypeptidase family protein n=1 Tax=uncultured Maritalea sp. TaxID=757249 RepID=UPI0022BCC873|nr:D-alanyl-D-alanine carboxypeptidase family protein [uncultured Maritalea sp.]MCZ4273095.1 D-alanyl-D-alanine carboxypeptidase [Maritalea porphyrae]